MFQPNSKTFSDVKSVSYVGQFDVSNMDIKDIWAEQSGNVYEVYAASDKTIMNIRFQLGIDGDVEVIE